MTNTRIVKKEENNENDHEHENEHENENEDEDYPFLSNQIILRNHLLSKWTMIKPFCIQMYQVSNIYILWFLLHFFSAHLYTRYCVPSDLNGFFLAPFYIASPHCKALRWINHKGGDTIDSMWIVLGTWLCSKCIFK